MIAALSAWLQLHATPPPLTALGLAIVVVGLSGSVLHERRNTVAAAAVAAEMAA